MRRTSIYEEIESHVNEEELDNFLESSVTVEIEIKRKINTIKIHVKMKTEPVTASAPPTPSIGNDNRIKLYVKLPRLGTKKFSGDYIQQKLFMDSF